LGICLYCPDHGAFSPELERLEVGDEMRLFIEWSMSARELCMEFISELTPKLAKEMRLLFLKGPKWNVRLYEAADGSVYLAADKTGISVTRPGIWGVPMAFYMFITWSPTPVNKELLKDMQDRIFKQYDRLTNAANLVIIFAPAIVEEAASYCAEQKTCKRLAQQGLNQVGFVVVGPGGDIISEVSGRLRGYVKHHFPEAYELLSRMRGWE